MSTTHTGGFKSSYAFDRYTNQNKHNKTLNDSNNSIHEESEKTKALFDAGKLEKGAVTGYSFDDIVQAPRSNKEPTTINYPPLNQKEPIPLRKSAWAEEDNADVEEELSQNIPIDSPHDLISWVNTVPKTLKSKVKPAEEFDESDEYDTDIDVEETFKDLLRKDQGTFDGTGANMYKAACEQSGEAPNSFFIRHITDRHLEIKHRYFSITSFNMLMLSLKNNTMVEELSLEGNCLNDDMCLAIGEMLSENCFLLRVDLSHNTICNEGMDHLSRALASHDNLRTLNLKANKISSRGTARLGAALSNNIGLQVLDLSENAICGEGFCSVFTGLTPNTALIHLDLSWNHVQTHIIAWKGLNKFLKANRTLEILNLSRNGSMDYCPLNIYKTLKTQNILKMLDLSHNWITSDGCKKLALALMANECLEVLSLSHNPIGEDAITLMLKKICNNATFKVLLLSGIQLSSNMLSTISDFHEARSHIIILYETNRCDWRWHRRLTEKISKFILDFGTTPMKLYFQKPCDFLPAEGLIKTSVTPDRHLESQSVLTRSTELNVNFSISQQESILLELGCSTENVTYMTDANNNPSTSENEISSDLPDIPNGWQSNCQNQFINKVKNITSAEMDCFLWHMMEYVTYMKNNIVLSKDQEKMFLDGHVLRLLTLKEIFSLQ